METSAIKPFPGKFYSVADIFAEGDDPAKTFYSCRKHYQRRDGMVLGADGPGMV
jgi:hypothetical protein